VGVGAEKSQVETSNPELETQNSELKSATDSEVNKPDPKTKASSARVKARGRQVEVIGRGVRALDSQSPTLQPSGTRSAQLRLKRRETSQRPETIAQKKESGVTSLLKQTGRILKKPFKF
jgi:hypothetical protein